MDESYTSKMTLWERIFFNEIVHLKNDNDNFLNKKSNKFCIIGVK